MLFAAANSRLTFPDIPIVMIAAALADHNSRAKDEQRYRHDGVAEVPSQHGRPQGRQPGTYSHTGARAENWAGRLSGQEGL
ncbi:MAG: hypothetical protein ACU0BO_13700 [Limimaricola soesokkakensis]